MKCLKAVITSALIIVFSNGYCESKRFQVDYQWSIVNYTWKNQKTYNRAISTKRYIPENNSVAGIKFYKDKLYIAMSRACKGTPVTLGFIPIDDQTPKLNPLITPFPDWKTNDLSFNPFCNKLQNVQSMEIDTKGIMWVLDGFREDPQYRCPPKLVLYDLNKSQSKVVHTFIFPDDICLRKGGFLNDIVIDETDGGFAYITDNGQIDPGLIVYSRKNNSAWKLRDRSMFAEIAVAGFVVGNVVFTPLTPIDGIALSPKREDRSRTVYYSAVTALSLYSISTEILKDQAVVSGGQWRENVTYIGKKQAPSDGMTIDDAGNLYYGLLPLYSIGRWNIYKPFSTAEILDTNSSTMIWADSFAFDNKGYVYNLANDLDEFLVTKCKKNLGNGVKFRVLKYFTGTKSYLH